jgi:Uma2 family endonuclease
MFRRCLVTTSILEEAAAGRAIIQPLTVKQYHKFIDSGWIKESTAFELLDGFIVRKDRAKAEEDIMTVGDRHRIVVTLLSHLSPQFVPFGCFIQSQQPVSLPPHSEPEPDASIIRGELSDFMDAPPAADDVECIIEVADSSLPRDLGLKLRMYANAGISQYVVVDLVNNVVLDHRKPKGKKYADVTSLRVRQTIELRAGGTKSVSVSVSRLLP